jgi:hypothetical protein
MDRIMIRSHCSGTIFSMIRIPAVAAVPLPAPDYGCDQIKAGIQTIKPSFMAPQIEICTPYLE